MNAVFNRIRQPEYTGANRCLPCTVLNVLLATGGAAIVALWSPLIGLGALGTAFFIIYVRGYLIPGTPELTKRYFPTIVLEWFGKTPKPTTIDEPTLVDPEKILREAGAVTRCENGTDLCLTREFRDAWHERDGPVGEDIDSDAIRQSLNDPTGELEIEDTRDGFVAVNGENIIHQWPSSAAAAIDVSAADLLAERHSQWDQLSPAEKGRVLASLRVFRDECPLCDGPITLGQEVVESCCSSHDVVMVACQECDTQLLEVDWMEKYREVETEERQDESRDIAA